jgi:hypothetical protein
MESLLKTLHSILCKALGTLGLENLDFFDKSYNIERSENVSMGINGNALLLTMDNEIRYGAQTDYEGNFFCHFSFNKFRFYYFKTR